MPRNAWTEDRDYKQIRIDMQTLFGDLGLSTGVFPLFWTPD
jgi:hypothetical protein